MCWHSVRVVIYFFQMTLVFNEKGLAECIFPCVAQSFVNHNAVLYKLFALGESYGIVERPSIKNLEAAEGDKYVSVASSLLGMVD